MILVSQYLDLGNLGSWEQTLQRGSPMLFLWVAPLRWARPTSSSLNPCSLWSWKQTGWSVCLSLSLSQNWGRCDNSKDLGRNQRQGGGDKDRQSWGAGGTFKDEHSLRSYTSISVQNFRNKQKWDFFLHNFLKHNRKLKYVCSLCSGTEVVKHVPQKEHQLRLYSGSSLLTWMDLENGGKMEKRGGGILGTSLPSSPGHIFYVKLMETAEEWEIACMWEF